MIGTIIGGVLGLGAAVASAISKKRQQQRAQAYDTQLREYNTPASQVYRYKQAGINTFGAEYQNTADANYDPSQFDYSENAMEFANVANNTAQLALMERAADDQHELAEQSKEFNGESLFSARTLNKILGEKYDLELTGKRLDNVGKELDNEGKQKDNAIKDEDLITKKTYNARFAELLSEELNIKKFTAQRVEQQIEAEKATVLANQKRYQYMLRNPQEFYRQIEHEFEYSDKVKFYQLESYRIQHLLDLIQEDLEPQTREALQSQLAYTISHSEFGKHNDEFSDNDVIRYIDYGLEKMEQIGNAIGTFGKLGVYRNLSNGNRFGPRDYSQTWSDENGEIRGGTIRQYSR